MFIGLKKSYHLFVVIFLFKYFAERDLLSIDLFLRLACSSCIRGAITFIQKKPQTPK
jgi:hypothetical protein